MGGRKIEMVRKEILTVLMADGYPIDGKPKEKTEKMHPEIWKRYALFAIAILLAGVVAYFAFAANAPVKSGGMMGGKVQTNNPVVNAATGAVAIPADALVIPGRNSGSPKIPINKFPKSIFVDAPHTLWTNIRITDTAITGWAINTDYIKNPDGTVDKFLLQFWKGNDIIGEVGVEAWTGDERIVGYSGNGFRVDRPPKTLGADSVSIEV